jgi:hypothetical protein
LHIISSVKESRTIHFFKSIHQDILAAHLEFENTIAKILLFQPIHNGKGDSAAIITDITSQIFADNPAKEFSGIKKFYADMSIESSGVNTISNTMVRRAIYTIALSDDEVALQTFFNDIAALNTDIVLASLDCVSIAWKNKTVTESLYGASKAYINLLKVSINPEVCAYICYELADFLDKLFASKTDIGRVKQLATDLNNAVIQLDKIIQENDNPSFSNARIRISGFLMVIEHTFYRHDQHLKREYTSRMEAWGRLLWDAGNARNVCLCAKAGFANTYDNRISILDMLLQQHCNHFLITRTRHSIKMNAHSILCLRYTTP